MLQQLSFEKCGNIVVSSNEQTITLTSHVPIKLQHSERWLSILPDTQEQTVDDIINEHFATSYSCSIAGGSYGILNDCYTREVMRDNKIFLYIYCPSKYTCEVTKPIPQVHGKKNIFINGIEYDGTNDLGSVIIGTGMYSVRCTNHSAKLSGTKLYVTTVIQPENIVVSQTKFPSFDTKKSTTNVITIDKRTLKKIYCDDSIVTFDDNIFDQNLVIANSAGHIEFPRSMLRLNQVLVSINGGGLINFNSTHINSISIIANSKTIANMISGFVLYVGGFIHADGKCDVIGQILRNRVDNVRPSIVSYCDAVCNINIDEVD